MTTSERTPTSPDAEEQPTPRLEAGDVVSVGGLSHRRVLALAAAAAPGSDDPVDQLMIAALREDHPAIPVPTVDPADVDPPREDRRYSLTRVRALQVTDGSTRDVVIMRGDLRAVMGASSANRENRSLLRKNALHGVEHGWRPLVIAAAPVAADGSVGGFVLQGFVNLRPIGGGEDEVTSEESYTRVDVWSISLRLQHWLNVFLIVVLSLSGYYIMDPFFGPTPAASGRTGYLMGYVRLIHFSAAFAWLLVGATRVVSAFTSRDRYLRWPTLWPLKSKKDVRNLGRVVKHYAFLRDEGPLYLAHNPLQQLAYTGLYLAGGLQMLVGFSLYALYKQTSPFWQVVATPTHWIGIGPVRLVHTMLMFALWAFAIGHIYLAVRADSLDRHGGVSSMINGGVWLRRGSKPVDSPKVG
ncbi:MAG: Ni/Fe-hydrogenase, b-type cytochrome subunit [Cellulomonas sp.]|nr:Ni/Fe-hydrogenase, b-type cytochrome subunit [Cellulomonas sp.]